MKWTNLELDQVRSIWQMRFGGVYPDEMIEAYLGFVESMAGTATFAMQLLKRVHEETSGHGGELSSQTTQDIEQLLARNYTVLRPQIKAEFQALFREDPDGGTAPSRVD